MAALLKIFMGLALVHFQKHWLLSMQSRQQARRAYCPNIYTVSKGHNEATSGGRSDTASILSMPKPRLRFLQLVRTQLLRQSEDCLYLNVFVPKAALVAASAASKASDGRPRKRKQQQKRGKNRIHHSSIFRVPCGYIWQQKYCLHC